MAKYPRTLEIQRKLYPLTGGISAKEFLQTKVPREASLKKLFTLLFYPVQAGNEEQHWKNFIAVLRKALCSDAYKTPNSAERKLLGRLCANLYEKNDLPRFFTNFLIPQFAKLEEPLTKSNIAEAIAKGNYALAQSPLKDPNYSDNLRGTLGYDWDNLLQGNIPWPLDTITYIHSDSKQPQVVNTLRHGTPIVDPPFKKWGIGNNGADPTPSLEFTAYINFLEEQNINYLYVNHQMKGELQTERGSSQFNGIDTGSTVVNSVVNPPLQTAHKAVNLLEETKKQAADLTMGAEKKRSTALECFAEEHKKNFFLLTLPLDSDWLSKIDQKKNLEDWKNDLVKSLILGTNGFALPKQLTSSQEPSDVMLLKPNPVTYSNGFHIIEDYIQKPSDPTEKISEQL